MCKCGRIPPCYGGKKFRIHEELEKIKAWYETHDKVYELIKQMCDIDKHLSEAGYFRMICDGQIETRKKLIDMEEKKTKKMTKAEAFEWLKSKKVSVANRETNDKVQSKLFACGVEWKFLGTDVRYYGNYLVINPEGFLCHCAGMGEDYWNRLFHEEISADDILSIEIVEKCAKDDEDPYFGGRIKDLQEMIEDDEVLIITKTNFLTMMK